VEIEEQENRDLVKVLKPIKKSKNFPSESIYLVPYFVASIS